MYDEIFCSIWCIGGDGLFECFVSLLYVTLDSKGTDWFRSPNWLMFELDFLVFSENLTLHDPGDRAGVSSFWIWTYDAGGRESEVEVG